MTVKLIDSHCHLQDPAFDGDRDDVYRRAQQSGIGLIVPGYTMPSSKAAVAFACEKNDTWALVGIHPHDAKERRRSDLDQLSEWVAHCDIVAGIGEIGLDYHYNHSLPEVQRTVFLEQLTLARELNVAASVHTREAEEDTWQIIRTVGHRRGVIHCFTGTPEFAQRVVEFGWSISFSGAVTFKNAHDLRKVAETLPFDRLLIETDAPYLSPVPWRGQRNEPMRVIRVAEVLAALKNCSTEQLFAVTMGNAATLFSLAIASRE
ncbi:MAG: TatD family deoxyribonuclease [Sulfobacillus acidophilus]|uniref:TatD family deoxyribonuclease n=1 Tax=Sulfobacillus acidophilus TaxID=53633 RepID=A0A2T2WH76_9FIRM|nr:MAG: TatD family deoxyribonuclease [Sulfobacillus acidophilus]